MLSWRTQLLLPVLSFILLLSCEISADVIHLKNGSRIECLSAREEGNEVRYVLANGTMSIPKSIVLKVEKTDVKLPPPEIPREFEAQKDPKLSVSPSLIQTLEQKQESSIEAKQKLAEVYIQTGLSSINKGQYSAALDKFHRAYELVKNEATLLNLGLTYFLMKDIGNSQYYFEQLLQLNPKNVTALNYLAKIAWQKEDLSAAEGYWRTSYEIRPDEDIRRTLEQLKKEKSVSQNYSDEASQHFLIRYDGGTAEAELIREISDFLEEAYQRLSSQYEAYPTSAFVVVIYPRLQFFRATDAPRWAAGLNDGKIRVPVKGMSSLTDELKEHLLHELSHSFVDVKSGDRCPAWLHEGLAEYSEGKRLSQEERTVLRQLIDDKRLPAFTNLEATFATATSSIAAVLYVQSLSFVEYLTERHGFYQLNELLDKLGRGVAYQQAFEETFLVSLAEMESRWRQDL